MRAILVLLLAVGAAFGGEDVIFSSGARQHIDRHEYAGSKVTLFFGDGVIELDAAQIKGFEPDDYVPPIPAPPKAAPPAAAPDTERLILEAAQRYGLDANFLRRVVKAESGFRQEAVSPKGAVGLMQLMPGTAAQYGADPHDARQNIDIGARYLAELLIRYKFGAWHALAAYNAGPGAVDKYDGVPPYPETRAYIARILAGWKPK